MRISVVSERFYDNAFQAKSSFYKKKVEIFILYVSIFLVNNFLMLFKAFFLIFTQFKMFSNNLTKRIKNFSRKKKKSSHLCFYYLSIIMVSPIVPDIQCNSGCNKDKLQTISYTFIEVVTKSYCTVGFNIAYKFSFNVKNTLNGIYKTFFFLGGKRITSNF